VGVVEAGFCLAVLNNLANSLSRSGDFRDGATSYVGDQDISIQVRIE
jgi:hypothetical protein